MTGSRRPSRITHHASCITQYSELGTRNSELMIQAAIFDMDGLLLDTEAYWDAARHAYVAERGGHWVAADQVAVMGLNSTEWARYLQRRFGLVEPEPVIIAAVVECLIALYQTQG